MTKITFRGYNRVKFQSLKLSKTVFCQSLILRDYLLHLEWDENVLSYELKPFKISYKLNGIRKTMYPHVLVTDSQQQSTIIWLKSSVADEVNHHLTVRLLTSFCETKGFCFQVKSADEIRKEPFFSNLKFLRRYSRCEINFQHTVLCSEFFNSYSDPNLGNLIQFFRSNNENPQTVYALLFQKNIETDITESQIDHDSNLTLKKQFPAFRNGRIAA